jgi:TonB family protein
MRASKPLLWAVPLLCGALLLRAAPRPRSENPLQSFYIVADFFSDALWESYNDILEVAPQGHDVCVRLIRLSTANPYCGGNLIRAAERVLPNTSVRNVTGSIDVCSYTENGVASALKAASPKALLSTDDSASMGIVAKCGTQEKVFDFPFPAEVDMKALDRKSPHVRALWDLYSHVRRDTFGKTFTFNNLPAAQEKELEDLGTKLLPELVSGRFDVGFGDYTCGNQKCDTNYLAWLLRGYTGPPNLDPASVELLDQDSLRLTKFDLPRYPPLAKVARISGEVRVRITLEPGTGLVQDVQALSGHALLRDVVTKAIKTWQFSPPTASDQPIEATMKFDLNCK